PRDSSGRRAIPAAEHAPPSLLRLPGGLRLDRSEDHRDQSPLQLHSHGWIRVALPEGVGIRTAGDPTRALLQRRNGAAQLRSQFDRPGRRLAAAVNSLRVLCSALALAIGLCASAAPGARAQDGPIPEGRPVEWGFAAGYGVPVKAPSRPSDE